MGLPCFGTPAVVPFPLQNAVSVEWVPMAYPPHGSWDRYSGKAHTLRLPPGPLHGKQFSHSKRKLALLRVVRKWVLIVIMFVLSCLQLVTQGNSDWTRKDSHVLYEQLHPDNGFDRKWLVLGGLFGGWGGETTHP